MDQVDHGKAKTATTSEINASNRDEAHAYAEVRARETAGSFRARGVQWYGRCIYNQRHTQQGWEVVGVSLPRVHGEVTRRYLD